MSFGICTLSVIPCRKEPASTSEMVTQLLFGETYTIIEDKDDWLHIKTQFENYPCWITTKQHQPISASEFKNMSSNLLSSEVVQIINNTSNKLAFPITIGATIPNLKDNHSKFGDFDFTFDGLIHDFKEKKSAQDIKQTAYLFLNAPYLWGGKSPFGIDCSGFVQLIFKLNGYALPRDASQQVELGTALSFVEEAEVGDLAFFDNEQGSIVHVGLIIGDNEIIHASGCVRIDRFDHYGIFHSENKKYSHMLRVIKKVI